MPELDLADLDAFTAVARQRSFRGAATQRGVSASTLSEAVRRLEARLGVRLLNRTTRSVTPTEAGARLLDRLTPALGEVQAALDSLRQRFAELESHGADLLLDLALDLAHKLVQREVAVQRDAVLPVLREAIASVIDKHAHPRVHLNPVDHDQLRLELDADALFRGCRFIPDASIARGGCRVETAHGDIDARLETRWRRVLETLGVDAAS